MTIFFLFPAVGLEKKDEGEKGPDTLFYHCYT